MWIFILLIVIILVSLTCSKKSNNNKLVIKNFKLPTIHVINLKSSKDRWSHITKEFNKFNITNYKRFNARDGTKNMFSEWEMDLFKNFRFKKQKGVIGCALSHFYLWKKIVDENISECIICEDDISLKPNFIYNLNYFMNIKKDYELVFLYHNMKNKEYKKSKNFTIKPFTRFKYYECGAVIYYITNKAATHLYNTAINRGITRQADWYIYEQYKILKMGICKYSLVTTGDFESLRTANDKK